MLNFEFYNPARILFGKGMEEQVGKRMAALGGGCCWYMAAAPSNETVFMMQLFRF